MSKDIDMHEHGQVSEYKVAAENFDLMVQTRENQIIEESLQVID